MNPITTMSPNAANHVSNAVYDHVNEHIDIDWTHSELGAMIDAIWFLISRQYVNFSSFDYFEHLVELGGARR